MHACHGRRSGTDLEFDIFFFLFFFFLPGALEGVTRTCTYILDGLEADDWGADGGGLDLGVGIH